MVKDKKDKIKLKPREKLIKYLIENKEPTSIIQEVSGSTAIDYKKKILTI